MWTANRRIYLDKRGRAVEEGDEHAVTLLAGAWDRIPMEQAIKLGLVDKDGNTVDPKDRAPKAKES